MGILLQTCSRCILDTTDDSNIIFDKNGVCNFCHQYDELARNHLLEKEEQKKKLHEIVDQIKKSGKNREYDCVLGVSGGVDSSYVAYQAKNLNLKPLVVHYDNGWNSELAVKNIEKICDKLGFDLYTYVNDWEEFKDIQLAYLYASVIDIEVITDQGIGAILEITARKKDIKYILSGDNIATEGILPQNWYHWKIDVLNIKGIHKRFGSLKMKTYPTLNFYQRLFMHYFSKTKIISLLNYLDYDRNKAKKTLETKLEWRDYGGKHYESIFTRFYQGYILPQKFNVDKRKAHLSTMICSGQITREEAIEEIKKPIYDAEQLKEDKEFVLKKFELSEDEFEKIMNLPIKKHTDYPSYFNKHYRYQNWLSGKIGKLKRLAVK